MGGRVFKRVQVVVVVVIVAAILVFHRTAAETHTVGGELNWRTPPNATAYSTWAAAITFRVGDTLVFNFATGSHDVAVVNKDAFDACDSSNPLSLITNGPANYDLNSAGEHYFFCAVDGHCNQGQKFSISVSSSSNESPPSPPPPPPASGGPATPSPPPPPPPPPSGETSPPSSALPLAATSFSVIFFMIMSIAGFLW